jgi:predicted dehydrogenase
LDYFYEEIFMFENIGVIGLGNISARHRKNLKFLFPESNVIALSSRELPVSQSVPHADLVVNSMHELVRLNPGFVIVASPATMHLNQATKLIEAGIPSLIEKPLCSKPEAAKAFLSLLQNKQNIVAVGYCLRYMPSAQIVKLQVSEKCLGRIHTVITHVGQYLPDWRPDIDFRHSVSANLALGGGVLLELSHELDYLTWLFGSFDIKYAQLRNSEILDLEVEEIADLVLVNDEGTLVNLHMDFLQSKPQRWTSIIGDKGRLDWDVIDNKVILHTDKGSKCLYNEPQWDVNQMYITMLEDFVSYINSKKNQCVSVSEALQSVELIHEIKKMAEWGKKQ